MSIVIQEKERVSLYSKGKKKNILSDDEDFAQEEFYEKKEIKKEEPKVEEKPQEQTNEQAKIENKSNVKKIISLKKVYEEKKIEEIPKKIGDPPKTPRGNKKEEEEKKVENPNLSEKLKDGIPILDDKAYIGVNKITGYMVKPSYDNMTSFKRFIVASKVENKQQILLTIWKDEKALKNTEPILRVYITKLPEMKKSSFIMKNHSMDIERGTELNYCITLYPESGNPIILWSLSEQQIQEWEATCKAMLIHKETVKKVEKKELEKEEMKKEDIKKVEDVKKEPTAGRVNKLKEFFTKLIPTKK